MIAFFACHLSVGVITVMFGSILVIAMSSFISFVLIIFTLALL